MSGQYGAGQFMEKLGYRKSMAIGLLMMTCFVFIVFFSEDLPTLLVGEIFCGVAWGTFECITNSYASEVASVALRSYLTTYANICWIFGQILGSGVIRAF
jgi:SP family general alpha glucoside:H+ symporter-like MFS transporter